MTHFYEMDWNAKWDWESFPGFGSKAIESPKKRQMVDWTINGDGEIDAGSFNLSTGGGNSDASGSDGGNVSSAKSSISASHNSRKEGMQNPHFRLRTFNDIPGNFSNKMELKGAEVPETSPPLEVSISSVEPLIGLKLGKRMYFENSGALGNDKSASSLKKTKPSGQNLHVRCVVEGCNIDLSTAKEYHRKHKVCDSHSKCPKVIVGGLERRFCQQCSRFHNLSEFDEEKRSCRRRLSDHNARRRKPQQESVQFNSGRFSSPFYGARRQRTNFLFNSASLIHSRNLAITSSDSTHNSNFTLTRGCSSNFGDRVSSEQMQMQGIKLPHLINVQSNAAKGLVASKSSVTEVLNSGCKESQFPSSSQSDAAPECRRALSLLSSNPWASCGPQTMALNHLTHENDTQPMMLHGEGRPLSSSDIWLPSHQPSTHPARLHSFAANANFQEVQLFVTPDDTDFYSTILN